MVAVKEVRLPINNDKLQYDDDDDKVREGFNCSSSLKSTRQLEPEQLDQCE